MGAVVAMAVVAGEEEAVAAAAMAGNTQNMSWPPQALPEHGMNAPFTSHSVLFRVAMASTEYCMWLPGTEAGVAGTTEVEVEAAAITVAEVAAGTGITGAAAAAVAAAAAETGITGAAVAAAVGAEGMTGPHGTTTVEAPGTMRLHQTRTLRRLRIIRLLLLITRRPLMPRSLPTLHRCRSHLVEMR